jgi:hypothetical protein
VPLPASCSCAAGGDHSSEVVPQGVEQPVYLGRIREVRVQGGQGGEGIRPLSRDSAGAGWRDGAAVDLASWRSCSNAHCSLICSRRSGNDHQGATFLASYAVFSGFLISLRLPTNRPDRL